MIFVVHYVIFLDIHMLDDVSHMFYIDFRIFYEILIYLVHLTLDGRNTFYHYFGLFRSYGTLKRARSESMVHEF
jgi:hypothetical protein